MKNYSINKYDGLLPSKIFSSYYWVTLKNIAKTFGYL